MPSSAPLFLALRYLRPKRSFVSVITFISILGVMLGVGVTMVVMSVFKGWQVEFKNLLLGFEPHVVLVQDPAQPGEPESNRTNWRDVLATMKQQPGVVSVSPMAEGMVVIKFNDSDPEGVELFGLKDVTPNALLEKLKRHKTGEGTFDLSEDNIIITDKLARKLSVKVGDTLSVVATDSVRQMIAELRSKEEGASPDAASSSEDEVTVAPLDLTIVAIVRADTAGDRCYTPLHIAQELFKLESNVGGIEIEISDPDLSDQFAGHLLENGLLPQDWQVRTWTNTHGTMLQSVENQRSLMYFLLFFIMLVAAICVMNTTITVTVQKRREIGILTALGTQARQIISIFLVQAGIVAVMGAVLGLLGGMVVLHFRNDLRAWLAEATGRDFFPQDIYFLSEIPSQVQAMDLTSICGMAFALCLLAALLPAWFAARVDPAVALRD